MIAFTFLTVMIIRIILRTIIDNNNNNNNDDNIDRSDFMAVAMTQKLSMKSVILHNTAENFFYQLTGTSDFKICTALF